MYELTVTDLRPELATIKTPTLVLGAWAAFAQYGATKDSVRATFDTQYATLPGVKIELSEGGYHFLMWDDPVWLQGQVRQFLALK
jgi:pimeloyl-ACP methyl ester carboxylesterase